MKLFWFCIIILIAGGLINAVQRGAQIAVIALTALVVFMFIGWISQKR